MSTRHGRALSHPLGLLLATLGTTFMAADSAQAAVPIAIELDAPRTRDAAASWSEEIDRLFRIDDAREEARLQALRERAYY